MRSWLVLVSISDFALSKGTFLSSSNPIPNPSSSEVFYSVELTNEEVPCDEEEFLLPP